MLLPAGAQPADATKDPPSQPNDQSKDQPAADTLNARQNQKDAAGQKQNQAQNQKKPPPVRFDIFEYRVDGADRLAQIEVEEAVYPFLGPGRTADDVEKARAALEKAYQAKGYQTVAVSIPQQNPQNGVVVLKVVEATVGRLRVKGSRYFDLDRIKEKAPSVAEGKLPNFNEVTKDIVALNQWPDRKITPTLRAGEAPGTVDVDLNVEDKLPFHGSVELNNRQSPNTTPLRLIVGAHYDNLWQRGDSATFSYQVAPERPSDAIVYSGSYLARTEYDWLNILIYGVDTKSNVSSIGGVNVVGPGQIVGTRGVFTLPGLENLFHTVSFGIDYKHFDQTETQSAAAGATPGSFAAPVTYFPIVSNYTATFSGENISTVLNAGITAGLRGLGSDPAQFDARRFDAKTNFIYLRGDVTHTRDLPGGMQIYGRIQGQVADQPLVSSEQFTVTGADYVRGYLESEVLGDSAVVGTGELRTPNFAGETPSESSGKEPAPDPTAKNNAGASGGGGAKITVINDWRFFVFADGGYAILLDPLPTIQPNYWVASVGAGARMRMFDYAHGMLAIAIPLISQTYTSAGNPRVLFRFWGEF
jgi:hemolysin activation/secretion protein